MQNRQLSHIGGEVCQDAVCQHSLSEGGAPNQRPVYLCGDAIEGEEPQVRCACWSGDASTMAPT